MKKKVLVSAILSIALCLSLIAGATFALFTSESKVNIAVVSGKVKVTATIDETSVATKQLYDTDYTAGKDHTYQGEVAFDENGVKLDKFVPGDGVKFNIVIKNDSNVTVKYRTKWYTENDNGLLGGLTVNVDNVTYKGNTVFGNWAVFDGTMKTVEVSITLDESKGNEYQDKTCTLSFLVEAVQGNADTADAPTGVLEVYSAYDLKLFANLVNGGTLDSGYTEIRLMDDIDLKGEAWTPIVAGGKTPSVTFNGNGKAIKNLVVSGDKNVGFFGAARSCVIKNLTVDGAEVNGINHVGVIAGDALCTAIENCTVKNAKVTASVKDLDDGDKAGAIAGYVSAESKASVKNCNVLNCEITGYRDIGSVVGYANSPYSNSELVVTGNTVSNVKLVNDRTVNYKKYDEDSKFDVNDIVGEYGKVGAIDDSGNTASDVTKSVIKMEVDKNVSSDGAVISGAGKDITEVDMSDTKITADNVTIKDMTIVGGAPGGNTGNLDLNGKNTVIDNVKLNGQGFNGDTKGISVSGSDVLIRNSEIRNVFRGIIFWDGIGGDNVIENCIIEDVVYTFNINAGSVAPGTTLTVKNSTLNGWTSYSSVMSKVTFENCNLGRTKYGYAQLVAYADSEFTNCTFCRDYNFAAGAVGKTLVLTNCKLEDGTVITAANFKTLIADIDDNLKGCTIIIDGVTVNLD